MGWASGIRPWSPSNKVSVEDNHPVLSSELSGVGAVPLLRVNWSILNFANRQRERKGEGGGEQSWQRCDSNATHISWI